MMKTDSEIAREAPLRHIGTIAAELELAEDDFEFFGSYKGKIRLGTLDKFSHRQDGKLILVTAMTPTSRGEGKTLTTIGMGQALGRLGAKGIIALREPSLGPVFGMKGGAAGGGYSQVLPMVDINLHFNGDIHAVTTAHNLLSAMLDNHVFKGNHLAVDVTNVLWPRAMDMNDRSLRQIVIGLGGQVNGVPRESGFVITAASEVMAILALASSRKDLKRRLGEIVVGYTHDPKTVCARDLDANEAMAAILKDAIMPNLVQTIEHTPALIHAGPFANIAHGTSSLIATRIALKLADYVVTECGFGADLGAEKFFDIVCRGSALWPSAVVVVATTRAIKVHGGVPDDAESIERNDQDAFRKGLANLNVHVENMKKFGVPVVVTLNRFPYDSENEIEVLNEFCQDLDVEFAAHEAFAKGGEGAVELTEKTVRLANEGKNAGPRFVYDLTQPIEEKVRRIATEIYRADGVYFEKRAKVKIDSFVRDGYGDLPICVAKTQSSLSDNKRLIGVPKGWTLTVTDANLSAGAGFIVVVCGDMMLMPGLPKTPAAARTRIDDDGNISGLF
jgi:formate--tetrahydrofolate ligase